MSAVVLAVLAPTGSAHAGRMRPPPPAVRLPSGHLTVAVSGDVLPHSPVVAEALRAGGGVRYDFRPMFARLRPLVSAADVAICHLETPVAPPGEPLSTFPQYGVPREIAEGLAYAGYDRCSTASNHTLDRGLAGIDSTIDALRDAGLGQSGMASSPVESVPVVLRRNGIRFSHLSYTFGFNGARLPADQQWRSALIDPDRIIGDARWARAAGAEVVLVSLHWGTEGSAAPSADQRRVAAAVTASGAIDLVIGHHAHVLQPIERVNGVWVVYGLGNHLSNMPTGSFPPSSQDGAVVTVGIHRTRSGRLEVRRPVVHPTWVDRSRGFVVRPVLTDLVDPGVPEESRTAMWASLARTAAVLGRFVGGG